MKELFEKWAVTHFGKHIESVFADFDEEDGYHDQILNAMWIGFNGYAILKGE